MDFSTASPQFLYMLLVLPGLFGLVLLGEGISKIVHEEWGGMVSIILSLIFIALIALAYFFFSGYFQI